MDLLRSIVTRPITALVSLPSPRYAPTVRIAVFVLMGLFCVPALTWAAKEKAAAPTPGDVAEKKSDLKELRGQIEALRKEMTEAEAKRVGAADQLKGVEREISETQRELSDLTAQRNKVEATLKDLGAQARGLETRLEEQQAQLAKLAYRQYLQGKPDSLRLLLSGDDPSQMARDLYYLEAVGRARQHLLAEIETTLQRKKTLASDYRDRSEELAGIEARQKEQHGKLVAQREQRKAVLERISAKISEQRREIGNLQRDEQQLSQLIQKLNKIIATRKAQSRPVPRKESPQAQKNTAPGKPSEEIRNDNIPEAAPAGNFARLKGELRLPARGTVANRFGAPRQEGSTWKGLFIRAAAGSEVRAVAGGRVVFADWMRGFGNLVIVDHGGSYMSVYGNNDALLKQVGDGVRGGDPIASVGNSGGNTESGLYFELRHQGQPLDPLKWVSLK